MHINDFDYNLPENLIAQFPPKTRGQSRLLVLNRKLRSVEHRDYADLVNYLNPGDVVILNDTKVIKARLAAINQKNQTKELLLLENHHAKDPTKWLALHRGKVHINETLYVSGTPLTITAKYEGGIVEVSSPANLLELAARAGSVPLPPYMNRSATKNDNERYQTVFAKKPGSVAAPTASLNITAELEEKLIKKGVVVDYLTLHVGLGTFMPIRTNQIKEHRMHSEYFNIPASTIKAIIEARKSNSRIVAIGTTVARTIEFAAGEILSGAHTQISGEADIFIYPGYEFKLVDVLLTNFHAPRTTVLMLAAAFADWENLETAYKIAVEEKYSFLSYGDSMLII